VSKRTITVIPDALLERMAKAGYEEVVKRTEHLRDPDGRTWETETEALREDWRAIARAIQRSSGAGTSTALRAGIRRVIVPFVGGAVALVLLGGAGVALWAAEWRSLPSLSGFLRPAPAMSKTEMIEPAARRPEAVAAAPLRDLPAQEPTVPSLPAQSATGNGDPPAPAAETPEPQKPACTADLEPWPPDSTSQAIAIQILLRDLGFYSGTTRGTVGPATRAAIRRFQTASDAAETGEPSKILFESLQEKKCASAAPDAPSAIAPPAKD